MFFSRYPKLSKKGILGMNMRNADFILSYNQRHLYPLVDNKLKTKQLAVDAGITVPELYGVIQYQYQLRKLPKILARYNQFVIKPSKGSGGKGILVISGKEKESFIKSNGTTVNIDDIDRHVSNIVSGLYSLGGQLDSAMIEYHVNFSPIFEDISYQGVPDIRVIIFQGYPVMAMLRLPTSISDGKANLHQGAIGVGIDIENGKSSHAVCKDKPTYKHPDTGVSFKGLAIPDWSNLLILAARCYEITGLGYIGVDIVLDDTYGAMILELNARPGLAIQLANNTGLFPRLQKIQKMAPKRLNVEKRVNFVQSEFSSGQDANNTI